MGVSREARHVPRWLTWAVAAALVAVYVGERLLPDDSPLRWVLTGGGTLFVFVATGWRKLAWFSAQGDARAVERLFAFAYGGCALGLVLFLLAGGGLEWLGMESAEAVTRRRVETALVVMGSILVAASLLPALAAQWASGAEHASGAPTGAVDRLRVTQLWAAALTVALALPFLMLTGWVAAERDQTLDLSYFRTASPGSGTEQLVGSLDEPLRVLLFFPPVSDVQGQVRSYFQTLGAAVGNVEIEDRDRLTDPALAQEFGVVADGTIVLASGDRAERVTVPVDLRDARLRLRNLDRDVQQVLNRLAREARTVYLTVGHGELNDRGAQRETDSLFALESLLGYYNYDIRELGLQEGLARAVPEDAAMVVVLGPERSFLDAELQTLDRYLAGGGSLLLALEPGSEFSMGPLQERLAVAFHDEPLADEQAFVPMRQNVSDRGQIITNMVFSHAAVATASQPGMGDMVAFGAGRLEPLDRPEPRVSVLVRSMSSTFADTNGDFELSEGEARLQYPLAVAVEGGEALEDPDPSDDVPAPSAPEGLRAVVLADADILSDLVLFNVGLNGALVQDVFRWLGREEDLSGEIASEADVPIVHTRSEDVAWFYSTIVGAPALVLALGLLAVRRRRVSGRPIEEAA